MLRFPEFFNSEQTKVHSFDTKKTFRTSQFMKQSWSFSKIICVGFNSMYMERGTLGGRKEEMPVRQSESDIIQNVEEVKSHIAE